MRCLQYLFEALQEKLLSLTWLTSWTYWGCISEAFNCLEYSSSNGSHGEGSPTVVHNPPRTKIKSQFITKFVRIEYNMSKTYVNVMKSGCKFDSDLSHKFKPQIQDE